MDGCRDGSPATISKRNWWMSNATLCTREQECPDAQLCHEGQCQCAWRYGLTGDACDQWTARAVWRVTGQALCLLIYLAAGMHAYMSHGETIGYFPRLVCLVFTCGYYF